MIVQAISSGELWVNFAGVALARRLYRTAASASIAVTNSTMAMMITLIIPSSHCRSRASSVAAG